MMSSGSECSVQVPLGVLGAGIPGEWGDLVDRRGGSCSRNSEEVKSCASRRGLTCWTLREEGRGEVRVEVTEVKGEVWEEVREVLSSWEEKGSVWASAEGDACGQLSTGGRAPGGGMLRMWGTWTSSVPRHPVLPLSPSYLIFPPNLLPPQRVPTSRSP